MNLTSFKELIKQRCGLIFEGVGEKPLVDGLRKRIADTGSKNASAYYTKLHGDDREFYELVCLLTINETYFYREPEQLQLLVDCLIPRILSRKQDTSPVRIFSAGCSTGEEPYSIAMALREKYGESSARLFQLEGGDLDKGALDKARTARYTEFSFRSLAPELRDRYFERHGKWAWNAKADLRQQVNFHHLNLLDENYHHALQDYDIIFFRNVSIYFDIPTRRLIQQHLASLLKDDGCLIIGTAETLANDLGVLNLVEEGGQFYFAKQPVAPVLPAHHKAVTDWILPSPVSNAPRATQPCAPPVREAPSPPPRPPVAASVDEALRLTREKRYDDALEVIVRLLEQQPGATDALLLKAHILLHRKEYAVAEETAQRVLKTEAWSIDAFMVLALAAKWRNQATDAVNWFKQAVYACNECWPAHYYLAELYRADNEMEKARRSYRAVLQLLSGQRAPSDGLSIIPLDLPPAEVRFLCEHQVAKLDSMRAGAAR
jgi:chemotaxis protein methyltransferase CheR